MKARPLNHSFVVGGIRLNHLRLATLFLILTVLAALHTSIFGGGYNAIIADNIHVATTDNIVKSINTSVDDDVNADTDGDDKELASPPLIHEQNNTADNNDDAGGDKEPESPPPPLIQNATTVGEPYVNRWQRRFSDSENR